MNEITEKSAVAEAKAALEAAQQRLDQASAAAENRRHRIHNTTLEIVALRREIEVWNLTDFDTEITAAEVAIVEFYGSQDVAGRIHDIHSFSVLKRLKPRAVAQITERIEKAQAALAALESAI